MFTPENSMNPTGARRKGPSDQEVIKMEQDIFCPQCGNKLFDVDDGDPISYLREMVESHLNHCEGCGVTPHVAGVRFE